MGRLVFLFSGIFLFLILPVKCPAKSINVPGDYFTIQDAINAAEPGDTVKVAAGKYRENIRMRKRVNLIGAGAGKSKIKPVNDNTKNPIVLTADQCILEGFTFLMAAKTSPAAILVENSSPTIRNNVIKRNQTAGILIKYPGSTPLIERNRIYKNNGVGIKIKVAGGRIVFNEIFGNASSGISLSEAFPSIEENYIYRNMDGGISVSGNKNRKASAEPREAFIYKNKIEDNKSSGVAAENSSPTIIFNTISNKGKPALLLFSSNSVIKNNLLISNGPPAIRIDKMSSPIVENNTVEGALRFPIMNDSATARMRNNVIKSKWAPGIPIK